MLLRCGLPRSSFTMSVYERHGASIGSLAGRAPASAGRRRQVLEQILAPSTCARCIDAIQLVATPPRYIACDASTRRTTGSSPARLRQTLPLMEGMVVGRADVLVLAILGTLAEKPLHGYEIRKRLGTQLGPFRALSYGSLYPALKRMLAAGLIGVNEDGPEVGSSRRSRIVYHLTEDGKAQLKEELASAGSSAWEDDTFDVRFSMFDRTDAATRLRILEGRRSRLSERIEEISAGLRAVRERHDAYTAELQRHGLERVEREVEWLDKLIENERAASSGDDEPASAG